MLDTERAIETPEGIEIAVRIAGPVSRALAWSIDCLLRFAVYTVLGLTLTPLGYTGFGIFLIIAFLLEWFYPVIGEMYFEGQTPGKRALGLRVLNDDGTPVDWSGSMVRNLLRVVDFLPLFYAAGLICMLLQKDFKRLGDLAAGTVVVYREEPRPVRPRPDLEASAPTYLLTPTEQQATLAYAERCQLLTAERATELAELAGPLVAGYADPAARLVAVANWVAGSR